MTGGGRKWIAIWQSEASDPLTFHDPTKSRMLIRHLNNGGTECTTGALCMMEITMTINIHGMRYGRLNAGSAFD